jgi:thiosulfate dehydrogenase
MTHLPTSRSGLLSAVLVCAAAGVITVGAAVSRTLGAPSPSASPDPATEDYGRRLIGQTSRYLGPDQPDASMRYSGSRLACASCHLGIGTQTGTLTLLQTTEHYPRFSARVGDMTDIEDRINECMQRSMNGKPLPMDGVEMRAMAAYLRSLGRRYEAMGASLKKVDEPAPFKAPARAASLERGRDVFMSRCAICHGDDGQGLRASANPADGYVFPPLWGPDSFNDGAGMHRVLTASRFIKARMPLGKADLTSDEAFDVAAFINAQPRPAMANLDRDYPDRTAKPVDNAYGPFADPFPIEQHRFGPYGPIEAYYKALKAKK